MNWDADKYTALTGAGTDSNRFSRRRFMGMGAALVGAAVTEGTFAGPSVFTDHAFRVQPASPKAWKKLKEGLSGSLIRYGQVGYTRLSRPNNLRYQGIQPAGIALCEGPEDVATCLKWCQDHSMPLAARGGGHSYAGYSCTQGLMINLASLNGRSYDETTGRVTIGGGIRNGAIYAALDGVGRSITHGRCPTVGAGGFLLGGGIGFEMRAHGVGSDKLVSTEIVTADGSILTADSSNDSDLFWACRGGAGGNFGVNTAFTLDTFPVDRIVVFDLWWSAASDELIGTVVRALEAAPRRLGSQVYLGPRTNKSGGSPDILLEIFGQFDGTEAELREIIAPMVAMSNPASETIQSMPYWEGQYFLAEAGDPGYYQSRSRFVNSALPDDIIVEIRRWMNRWEPSQGDAYVALFQTGGAINDHPADATAFVHRSSHWLFDTGIEWDPTQSPQSKLRAHRWQNGLYAAVTPLAGGGAFQNFVDPSLKDWEEAYYGSNLTRLRSIKSKFDPDNLFRFPQSIRPQ